jgi:zinc protease
MNMRKSLVLSIAVAIISSLGGLKYTMAKEATGPRKVSSIEGITEFELENGLKVLLVPDASRPTVTVNLTVFVGSRHEGYGEAGMAHLLEHMLFKGTPTNPQVPKVLQAHGAKFNGTTWLDRTNYFETLPASDENLEFALQLEADRMMNSYVKGEDLASEMTVVRNEFERGENSPARILGQRMMSAAYEWHNYGKSTIGNRSDIERVPVDKLRDFYKRFYQPDNAMLVVAGRLDEARTLGLVQKYFGSIPRPTRQLDTTYTEEPAQDGERVVTLRRVGDVGIVGVAYHIPAGSHPDFAAVEVLESILTTAPSGRLYKSLVETKKASSVSGATYALHDPGVMRLMAEANKGNPPEPVLEALLDTTEDVGAKGVTEQEVERAKTQFLKHRELTAADSSAIAIELSEWAAQGDWRLYFLHRDRIEQVTAAQVKDVAARYLQRNNRTVGMYIPSEQSQRVEIPAITNLNDMVKDYKGREAIAAGESFDVAPQNIEKRTERRKLPGGLSLALLPKKTRGESVQLRLTLRYGTPDSLKGLTTAAEYLPELMLRGTKHLTREQLQDQLDQNRARLSASGSVGVATFTIQAKRSNLPAVLELLRQALREPTLPASELDVLKRRQLAGLEQDLTEPAKLASRWVGRQVSPYQQDDVRYVPTMPEEVERVKALDIESIQKLYREFLGAAHGQLSVVGDFDPSETVPELTKILADWKAPQPYARIERAVPREWTPRTETIRTPDKANAFYMAALTLPVRDDDPDYAALVVGDYILGAGALSSRLGDRIRQREGLSYGVASNFNADALDQRATWSIYAICNPSNSPKVAKAVREELELLIKDGLTSEELGRAKTGLLQRQEVSRTDDGALAQLLGLTLYSGRTMQYYGNLEAQIAALTPAQVTAALRKHLDPKKLVIAEAGDFAQKAAAPKPE